MSDSVEFHLLGLYTQRLDCRGSGADEILHSLVAFIGNHTQVV
ncbi:hypothetical protein [Mesorhizobium sp. M0808]